MSGKRDGWDDRGQQEADIREQSLALQTIAATLQRLAPPPEPPFRRLLADWERIFADTAARASRFARGEGGEDAAASLRRIAAAQKSGFARHLERLAVDSAALRANAPAIAALLQLAREWRESGYVTQEQVTMKASGPPGHLTITGEGSWSMKPLPVAPSAGTATPAPAGAAAPMLALPQLPYSFDALMPAIDAVTLREHYGVHHRRHVEALNRAEAMLAAGDADGSVCLRREAAYRAMEHELHTLYWRSMRPIARRERGDGGDGRDGATGDAAAIAGRSPGGALADALARDCGGIEPFRRRFADAARSVAGCGWAFLAWMPQRRKLGIGCAAHDRWLADRHAVPLLALDMWEHAYLRQYGADADAYIAAWWTIVDWPGAEARFAAAAGGG